MIKFPSVLACVTALLFLSGCGGSAVSIEVPQAKIQESLAGSFPMTTDDLESFQSPIFVSLTDPQTILSTERDQLGVRITITAKPPAEAPPPAPGPPLPPPPAAATEPLTGELTVFGDLEYESGKLFYRHCEVAESNFETLPDQFEEGVNQATSLLLAKYLDETPVYTFDQEEVSGQLGAALLKSITVADGKLIVELGW